VNDLGGNWRHDIVLEAILDHDDSTVYPTCVGGAATPRSRTGTRNSPRSRRRSTGTTSTGAWAG